MSDFVRNIDSLQEDLLRVAEALDEHCKNVRIARIVGSSVAITGTVAALIAAPFTMGASLAPVIVAGVFGGVGAVGGLTSGGAVITGIIIEKLKIHELKSRWEKFQEEYSHIADIQGFTVGDIVQIAKNLGANGKMVKGQVEVIVGVAAMANRVTPASEAAAAVAAAGKAAARGIPRLAMAARLPIIGLNVVLLGFSIYDIVDASIELHKKKKSKGGDLLREVVDKLEKIKMNKQTKI